MVIAAGVMNSQTFARRTLANTSSPSTDSEPSAVQSSGQLLAGALKCLQGREQGSRPNSTCITGRRCGKHSQTLSL